MPQTTPSPAFPTGSRVRDRNTGETYTVTGPSFVTGYTSVQFDSPDDDGCRTGDVRADDLEPVLSSEGMSTRAIAPIVGASQMQVVRDRASAETNVSPAPYSRSADEPVRTQQVTGMDGLSAFTDAEIIAEADRRGRRRGFDWRASLGVQGGTL